MPKLLHTQTGLQITKNDINQFAIVRLHYTADPSKRSEEWKAEAMAGMPPAKWAKEYEIDYTALFGERVFPELTANKGKIVIGEPHPELSDTQFFWAGFDYGPRNPSAFVVFTYVNEEIHAVWELYHPCKSISEFAAEVKACPYYDRIRYIAADPSIWFKTQQTTFGLSSIAQLFIEAGLHKLTKGNHDEQAWMAMMREHWADPEAPSFRIWTTCPNLIREFEGAVFASMSEKQLMTQNYREEITDHNNHALDATKYFMNSRPKLQRSPAKYPTMVKRWLK